MDCQIRYIQLKIVSLSKAASLCLLTKNHDQLVHIRPSHLFTHNSCTGPLCGSSKQNSHVSGNCLLNLESECFLTIQELSKQAGSIINGVEQNQPSSAIVFGVLMKLF